MKHAKFAPLLLLIFLSMGWTRAFAAKVYTPSSTRTMSAARTYCAGATASRISFGYNTCNLGTGTTSGTTMTVNWYRNTVNSTSGGTLVNTSSRSCRTRSTGTVTYTPSTATAGVFYYYCTITWTGTGTCNTSGTLTSTTSAVTVSAAPSAIAGSGTICLGTPGTLTNTASGGTWSTSNATVATVGSLTGVVSGVTAGTATISYRVACGTTVTKVVTVATTPTVAAIVGGATKICTAATTTLTNATGGGVWSTGNAAVATVGTSGIVTGVASGITNISYAVTNTCGTTYAAKEVTVTATPAAISGITNLCAGYTTSYTNSVPYGSWTSSNTAKATINASTGLITGIAAGTTLISYSTGCGAMATKALTVNASIGANSGTATVCEGATTTLSNAAVGGTWSSNNTAIATVGAATGVVIGVVAGTVAISYTTGGSCDAVTIVTVRATPASITGAANVCTGSTTPFANTSSYGTWSSSNAAVGSIVSTTGVATGRIQGTTTISYTTGCGTAATKSLTVYSTPGAIGGTAVVCGSATTTLTNSVSGGVWSTADAAIATVNSSTGVVTGVAAGLVNITYTNGTCLTVKAVTVNPLPNAGTLSGDLVLCDGDDSPISEDGDDGGTWSSANTTVATIDAAGLVTAQAAGTSVISYSVTNSCGTVAATAVVTVNAAPDAGTMSGTLTVCESATTTLTAGSGGVWSSVNTAVATVGTTGVVSGISSGTSEISYTVSNTCGVDMTSGVVTVNPLPAAGTITGTATVCAAATTTLSNATGGGAWTSGNIGVATVNASGVVSGVAAGTATISYAVTNSCGTAYATMIVTVNPLPAAGTITGTSSVCFGFTSALSNAVSGGAWTSSNTAFSTVNSTGVITGVSVGTATISYAVTNSCGTSYATKVATVNALPSAITGTTTVCAGSTSTLADATSGGTWASNNVAIATVNATTGVVTGVAGGSTNITYTLPTGCVANTSVSVTPLPVATVPGNQTICNGATQTSLSFSSSVPATVYSWTNSNPSIGLAATNTGTLCGTASENGTLVLTAPSGAVFTSVTFASYGTPTGSCGSFATSACHSSTSLSVVQSYVVGQTSATIPATNTVFGDPCVGAGKRLYVQATYAYSVVPSFIATNPGGSAIVGTVNVTPVANGCTGAPASFTITIDNISAPVAYAMTGGGTFCFGGSGVAVGLANSTFGINYQLKLAGSNVGSPVAGTGSAISFGLKTTTGTYTVEGTNTSTGCTNVMTGNAVVATSPVPDVTTPSNKSLCNGATQAAIPLTGSLAGTVYSWAVSNGTIGLDTGRTGTVCGTVAENGSLTLTAPAGKVFTSIDFASYGTPVGSCGTYSVGGCHATNSVTKAQLYLIGNNSGTIPATNAVFGDPCSGTVKRLYVQASYGSIPSFTAVNTGAAPVVATVTVTPTKNGCAGTPGTFTITVNNTPAAYAVTGGGSYCTGGAGVAVGLANSQTGINYQLKRGATTVGSAVAGTGSAISFGLQTTAGTYSVVATGATSGCTNNMTGSVTVSVGGSLADNTGTLSVCESATTTLANATSGGVWASGNAAVVTIGAASGIASGVTAGTASVTYTSGGCSATSVVTVNPLPAAGTITGTSVVCESATTSLTIATTGGDWSCSNASVATIATDGVVTAVAAGTATISYAITNSCGTAYTTQLVTVNPLPAAGTITGTAIVCEAATTTLANATSGGDWNCSNTSVATIATDGVVTAVAAGTATISYAITNSCGTAYATQVVTVNPLPAAGSITGSATVCVSSTTSLSNSATAGVWSSANTSIATVGTDGVVSGIGTGATTITYTHTNSCGTATATHSITGVAVPSVASVTGASSVCASATTPFANATSGGVWSSSNSSVATVDTDGVVSGVAAGDATISYILSNVCGSSEATKSITVNPSAASISGASSVCQGGSTTFSIADPAGTWVSGAPSVATINASTGVITSVGQGVSTITYTAATGCFYSVKDIVVNNTVGDITGMPRSCEGQSSTLACATAGGSWSSSNTSIATVNSATGAVNGVTAGSATITYTAASGCYTTVPYVVYAMPAPITGTNTICTGSYIVLYSTIGGSGTWSSSDTIVATADLTSGMISSASVGTAIITYKIPASGCFVTTSVTVHATPAAITGATAICAGSTQSFTSATTDGTWSSSQPSVATINASTGLATAVVAGNTILSYIMPTGCYRTYNTTVNPLPSTITYASNNICLGKTAVFASATTGGTWSSSNTAVGTIGSASGVATSIDLGSTTITYRIPTGCAITTTLSVYNALASITGNDIVCKGYSTTLANATSGGAWYSGSAGIASVNSVTGVVTGMSAGTSRISYMLTGGCLASKTMTVAGITGTPSVCVGLNSTLCHGISGGTWSSSNTSVITINATTGVMTGVATGSSIITYNVGGGIYNTTSVVCNALPAAITGSSSICTESNALYTGTVGGSATWSSSDVSKVTISTTSGMATAVSAGTATITYKIPSSGCYTTRQVTVNPTPAAISGPSTACVGTSITLTSATEGGTWSSNPTTVATVGSASGVVAATSAGGVTISYVMPTGCRRTKVMTVNVSPAVISGPSVLTPGSSSAFSCATSGGSWTVSDAAIAAITSAAATSASVSAVSTGVTVISYTFSNGCWKSKEVSVVGSGAKSATTESFAEAAADLKLYPNPTSGTFTIEASMNGNLSIYTFDGKLVSEYQLTGNTTTVSLPSNLVAGIYICQFRFDDGSTKSSKLYFQN